MLESPRSAATWRPRMPIRKRCSPARRRLQRLLAEMKRRIRQNDCSVPAPDGPWLYYSRFVAGAEYPRFCRRPCSGGGEAVLLDGAREAKGKPFWDLQAAIHSPDHALFAYAVDVKGPSSTPSAFATSPLEKIFRTPFPTRQATSFGRRTAGHCSIRGSTPIIARCWSIATASARSATEDILVYHERDPAFDVNVGKTQSGAFIVIEADDHQTSEIWLIAANDPSGDRALLRRARSGTSTASSTTTTA